MSLPLTSLLFLNSQRRATKLSIRFAVRRSQPYLTCACLHNHAYLSSLSGVVQAYNNQGSTSLNHLPLLMIWKLLICYRLFRIFVALTECHSLNSTSKSFCCSYQIGNSGRKYSINHSTTSSLPFQST